MIAVLKMAGVMFLPLGGLWACNALFGTNFPISILGWAAIWLLVLNFYALAAGVSSIWHD